MQSKNQKVPELPAPGSDTESLLEWYKAVSLWLFSKSSKEKSLSRWRAVTNSFDSMIRARAQIQIEKTGDLLSRIEQLEERLPK